LHEETDKNNLNNEDIPAYMSFKQHISF